MASVSACLIVRDEEAHLPGCLQSLAGRVDEIVLVDTGSSDGTRDIAARFGCRIVHHPWQADFSAPRNAGLDQARCDWILYIDADERLTCAGDRPIGHVIEPEGYAGLRVKFRARPEMTPYGELRLFRNDPRIRFAGAMHETVLPALERVCHQDGGAIGDAYAITISHLGYEGDQARKHARNLPLLEKAISQALERVYLRCHLGETLRAVGRLIEAESELRLGLDLACRDEASAQVRVEGSLCAQILSAMLFERKQTAEALAICLRGLHLYPANYALLWTKARLLVALGRAQEAILILQRDLDRDPATFFDPAIGFEKKLFAVDRWALMGSARFRLADYEGAAQAFETAARYAADTTEFAAKAALARARHAAVTPR